MRYSLQNKILKIWIDKNLIKNEALSAEPSKLWQNAVSLSKLIANMQDTDDKEKLHYADSITQILE